MYSRGASRHFDFIDGMENLAPTEARRLLSRSYTALKSAQLEATSLQVGDLANLLQELRRLAAALETDLLVRSDMPEDVRESSAFVAAEALEVASRISSTLFGPQYDAEGSIWSPATHDAVEAALLYFIAQHYTNAAIVANDILPARAPAASDMPAEHAAFLYDAIVSFVTLDTTRETDAPGLESILSLPYASQIARAWLAQEVGRIAISYTRWLRYESDEEPDGLASALSEIGGRLEEIAPGRHGDILGLVRLMNIALEGTTPRALRSVGWVNGADDDRTSYLSARCKQRPLLWPPAVDYARQALPGPHGSAVVSVPTGSGKSFVAEIALVQALRTGYAIYLVPTNALANQVRRDLTRKLEYEDAFQVQAFLGGQEFTLLDEETPHEVRNGTVVVMTPEKCALALRLSPDAFANVSLLVFDECHLIGDTGTRGATAELVLAHILYKAPSARVLLLSALIENPRTLADWLSDVLEHECTVVDTPWRPTRTLRGVIGIDANAALPSGQEALDELALMPPHRKNRNYEAPLCALFHLQGSWESRDSDDYALVRLPVDADLKVSRKLQNNEWRYRKDENSYVNTSTARLCSYLASQNERVLAFVPRSRHDPFGVARKIVEAQPDIPTRPLDAVVEANLLCGEYELGAASEVADLLRGGVGTHSSAMLDEERNASERAFEVGSARVLIATGTLAQGLNLPASVVVIGGTTLAGGRGGNVDEGHLRAQLLNAVGRAGRAQYTNHGLALVVPDRAIYVKDRSSDARRARGAVDFLRYEDASTTVTSALTRFLRRVDSNAVTLEGLSLAEMAAFTYAPLGEDVEVSAEIYRRSLGVWEHRSERDAAYARRVGAQLAELSGDFLRVAAVPEWLLGVAYRAGVPLPLLFAIYRACRVLGPVDSSANSVDDWTRRMVNVLSLMDVEHSNQLLWSDSLLGGNLNGLSGFRFKALVERTSHGGDPVITEAWRSVHAVVTMFIAGEPLADIARYALDLGSAGVKTGRSAGNLPLPKIIFLTKRLSDRMSILAGVLNALHLVGADAELESEWRLDDESFGSLQLLPVAMRSGCGDRSSLSWFRFGLRYRRVAHLLARAFPVPGGLDDGETKQWVIATRREWIGSGLMSDVELTEDEARVLEAARTIVTA